jgi:O-antigen/teichoic acid export membrane protein
MANLEMDAASAQGASSPRISRLLDLIVGRGRGRSGAEAIKHATVLVGGTAAGQAIALVATPALTRLYSPTEFGLLALVVGFLNVASMIVTLRYDLPVPSAPTERAADRIVTLALAVAVPGSVGAAIVLHFLIRWNVLSYGVLPRWTPIAAAPALFAAAAFTASRAWAIRAHRFGDVSRLLVAQGVGRGVTPIAWKLGIGGGLAGLLAGEIAGRLVGCVRLLRIAWPRLRPWARISRAKYLWREGRRHWQMPLIAVPSGLLDVLGISLPSILLANEFGTKAAGLFLLVQRLIFLPISLVGASTADIFHVRIAAVVRADPTRVRGAVIALASRLLAGGILCMLPVALLAPKVLPFVLGPAWSETGALMVMLIPWSIAALVVSPVSRLLVVVGQNQRKLIYYDGLAIAAVVGPVLGSTMLGADFHHTVLAISISQSVADVVYFGLILTSAPRAAIAAVVPTPAEGEAS